MPVLPAPAGRLAGLNEGTRHGLPAELRSHFARCDFPDVPGEGPVLEQPHDCVRKRTGFVGDECVRPIDDGQPSTPMEVDTMGFPMAIASNTLSLVPPPILSGIT